MLVALDQRIQHEVTTSFAGMRRPDAGGDLAGRAAAAIGLVARPGAPPRGLAARFVSGYLIQLQPTKPRIVRRAPWPISSTCTPGPRCTCRRWLGRARCDSGTALRRRPHPARLHVDPTFASPIADDRDGRNRNRLRHDGSPHPRARARQRGRTRRVEALLARGNEVDHALARGDVRLTMGGEPTFDSPSTPTRRSGTPRPRPRPRYLRQPFYPSPEGPLAHGATLNHSIGQQYSGGERFPSLGTAPAIGAPDEQELWNNAGLLAVRTTTGDDATATEAAAFAHSARRAAAGRSGSGGPGLRGHSLLPLERTPAADQRPRRGRQAARPVGAGQTCAGVRSGSRGQCRQRIAAAACHRRRLSPLAVRQMVLPGRRTFSGSGRQPDRPAPAAGGIALDRSGNSRG